MIFCSLFQWETPRNWVGLFELCFGIPVLYLVSSYYNYYYYYSAIQSPSAPATVDSLPDFVLEHPSAGDISVCLTRRCPLRYSLSTSYTGLSSPSCLITWYIDIYIIFFQCECNFSGLLSRKFPTRTLSTRCRPGLLPLQSY